MSPMTTSQRVLPHEDKPHQVYVLRDNAKQILYVGVSSNVESRIAKHRSTQPWRTSIDPAHTVITEPMPWEKALALEEALIQQHQPSHNTRRTNGTAYVTAGVRAAVAEERRLKRAARHGGEADQKALADWQEQQAAQARAMETSAEHSNRLSAVFDGMFRTA